MLMRIIGKRDLEELKTVNNMRVSPHFSNRKLSRLLNKYFKRTKNIIEPLLFILGDDIEEQIRLATAPHIKRKLRIKAIKELISRGEMLNSLFMQKIAGKIKIPEFAKNGKKPRLIGDYSCPGSLLAGFLVPIMKYAFSQPQVLHGSRLRFVYSTDAQELDQIFEEADKSIFDEYIFFSDDMCCKVKVNGVYRWFNLDISSCDASNGPPVFERLLWFFDHNLNFSNLMSRAVMQCQQRLVIHHPNGKKVGENVSAKPTVPIEFSGTQLTTILNNIAASSICISICYHLHLMSGNHVDIDNLVTKAALAVGYEVTVDHCEALHDVQFLKHSFYHDEQGHVRSFVNAGALLRSFGTCWMDLPFDRKLGESLEGAARMRNWQTLQGFKHSGLQLITTPLLESPAATKYEGYKKLLTQMTRESEYKMYISSSISQRRSVPVSVFSARYSLDNDELNQLLFLLQASNIGDVLTCSAIDKIMTKDYGYPYIVR